MPEPLNVFQSKKKHSTLGNLSFLSTQVAQWQKLTQLIQPLLPQPEHWQVACYQHGVLMLSGENQAMISQLSYLQKHYVQQLSQIPALQDLVKIQVCLRTQKPKIQQPSHVSEKKLGEETQQLLREAAHFVTDHKLSQALLRLASTKND